MAVKAIYLILKARYLFIDTIIKGGFKAVKKNTEKFNKLRRFDERAKKGQKIPPPIKLNKRYSLGEEIFNAVSHGTGGLLAIAGTVVLIIFCAIYSDVWAVVSAAVYGASLIILYTMSTLYHAITNEQAKKFFRIMDHNTIFFLIAGTYTPFTLVTLHGKTGWILFGIVWGAALVGITLNSINLEKFKKPSIVCYIAMGWVIIFAIKPMLDSLPKAGLILLLAGGVSYTVGVIFYAQKKLKYFHSIWHLFTVAGSVLHYFSVFIALVPVLK
ncbi:MAG: hemolysin III family protein [Clostridiales bacterium]|nr:hemolysin III family protein [Clostridiales bacterium]